MRNLWLCTFVLFRRSGTLEMVRYGADSKAIWLYVGMPGSVRD